MNNSQKKEPLKEGEVIQQHLDSISMDPWYFIYQNYVNPTHKNDSKKE
ncbi:MAG: hypothetical protein GTN97_02060 [Nitrosopumilaceae archaeon]|nr:hypothetical protein [Nitrosopumilaceae archaeon]NIP09936.1 hypothetical protein [Nitrosopumilaceae archaeon]NIS94707.1 hypothetical protein [Nitrosopumilaceae archaeon]